MRSINLVVKDKTDEDKIINMNPVYWQTDGDIEFFFFSHKNDIDFAKCDSILGISHQRKFACCIFFIHLYTSVYIAG